jgi:DNA-binding NarL/FixJ family response regulator
VTQPVIPPCVSCTLVVVHGRELECARIEATLSCAIAGRAAVVCLEGEPGAGKTALCEYAIRSASGFGVVTTTGVQGEADLPLAGLSSLLRPLVALAGELPEAHRQALGGALGLGGQAAADRFTLAAATLALLTTAAERQPLLVVIDDAQWLDPPSSEALSFALRRLQADAVAAVIAARPGESLVLPEATEVLTVGGLEPPAALQLLKERGADDIAPQVGAALVAGTGGLPLALIEAASQLSAGQRAGRAPLPDPLPVGPRLAQAYRQRLAQLPKTSQRALAAVAAAGSQAAELVPVALPALDLSLDDLFPAETAGVLTVTAGQIGFTHPLLRSVAGELLSAPERRKVHRALAEAAAHDPERHAWHLAAAATGPSEPVAQALLAAADAQRRGGIVAAAAILDRAAHLSPPGEARLARLTEAAQALSLAGQPATAVGLADEVIAATSDPLQRADAAMARGNALLWVADSKSTAEGLLVEARRVAPLDPTRAAIGLCQAAAGLGSRGEIPTLVVLAEEAYRLTESGDDQVAVACRLLYSTALVVAGRNPEAKALLEALPWDQMGEGLAELGSPAYISGAQTLIRMERFAEADPVLRAITSSCREHAAPSALAYALGALSELQWWVGRWSESLSSAEEAVALAEQTEQPVLLGFVATSSARSLAVQGSEDRCRSRVGEALAIAQRFGAPPVRFYALQPLGLLELSLARPEQAVGPLRAADAIRVEEKVGCPIAVPYLADLVEALIRIDDSTGALNSLETLETIARATQSRWAAATSVRCRALMARGHDADGLFSHALELLASSSIPFEQARTQLYWGEALRRRRDIARSRALLDQALGIFEPLGARHWAERARAELRAAGVRPTRTSVPVFQQLTSQELQVALAVAEGKSNRQIATALFVSPKTVEYHLGKVYAKLHVSSRTQLSHAIASARESETRTDDIPPRDGEVRPG